MDWLKTKCGIYLLTATLLLIGATFVVGYVTLPFIPLCLLAGMVLCLIGSHGRSRWAMIAMLVSFALALTVGSEIGKDNTPWFSDEVSALVILMIVLLAAGSSSFLFYADTVCAQANGRSLRPLFWGLELYVVAIAATYIGVYLQRVSDQTAEKLVDNTGMIVYLVATAALILLSRLVAAQPAQPHDAATPSLNE